MADNEYTFRIDIFTPETMPLARLSSYMAELAKLLGHEQSTHFSRLESGSACIVTRVDDVDNPKVKARIFGLGSGNVTKDVERAFDALDSLLANDNAIGELISSPENIVIPFPGRNRPKPLIFPAFRQDGSIDGQIVSIGGKDNTSHIILQDGGITYSNIALSREMARELRGYLYEQKVRLIGSGRWERQPDSAWKLLGFKVDRFEILDDQPLGAVLQEIRDLSSDTPFENGPYNDLMSIRLGDEGIH